MGMDVSYQFGRSAFRTFADGLEKEWLLTNGIGGFANSTIIGASNRIFSGYLIASLHPPVDRMLILAKTHESVSIGNTEFDLAAQEYPGELREGQKYLNRFTLDILPEYSYQVKDITIKKTIAMQFGENRAVVCYELTGGCQKAVLHITPLFTYRPFGDTCEQSDLKFQYNLKEKEHGGTLVLIPEKDKAASIIFTASDGNFFDRKNIPTSMATPNYLNDENEVFRIDQRMGFNGVDRMDTPYDICVSLEAGERKTVFISCRLEYQQDSENPKKKETKCSEEKDGFSVADEYKQRIRNLMEQIPFEDKLAKRLAWAADAFLVKRESTGYKTILAGYPWFADWGRDTMIALQGLTLATRRFQDAREVLQSFACYVKNGMIPNVFPNHKKEEPMYNTIDASLWYFYSADRYLSYTAGEEDKKFIKENIYPYLKEIIEAYQTGTLYGIHMDTDGLILGGGGFDQLTWMDVRVGDIVVTPRHGKAVEINALWYNALRVMEKLSELYKEDSDGYRILADQTKESFVKKFWNPEEACLYDVITCTEPKEGAGYLEIPDGSIRPNQIFAVSLTYTMLPKEKEKKVVEKVYRELYTPYGLRSLSANDPKYKSEYYGKLLKRDLAYHMGTVWGYLAGPFITAYCKVHLYSKESIQQAKEMCRCFGDHMEDGCLNGISEVFDGDFACTSRGCYTQAWSVAEVLRAYTEDVLPNQ